MVPDSVRVYSKTNRFVNMRLQITADIILCQHSTKRGSRALAQIEGDSITPHKKKMILKIELKILNIFCIHFIQITYH